MARDLTPGRIGFNTDTRLGIARAMAIILTTTIARNDDASSLSSITMKTIPADARPRVRSKTHVNTVECLRDIHPQQHDVAILQQLRKFGSGVWRETPYFSSSIG